MPLPERVKVKDIDRRHPEWSLLADRWDKMHLLYVGGCAIEARAETFLRRRPKELSDVYAARVERFSYHNHVGAATDYYLAAIFEKPPVVEPADGLTLTQDQEDFYEKFAQNCDRCGTPSLEKFREVLRNLLVFRKAYILTDLPPKLGEYANAVEERAAGQLDPHVCVYDPRQAINWSCDQFGCLEWIVFTMRETRAVPLAPSVVVDKWFYFDREQFAVYERVVPEKETKTPDDAEAVLTSNGPHAFFEQKRVPVRVVELSEGLWLMNRAYLPAQDHLNTDNVLGWALQMAALAMPVIKTDADVQPSLTEAGFILLPKDSDYAWAEPEGTSFDQLAKRASELKEDIYRSFYLVSQARTTTATPAAQSGVSKQQDMAPSKKVLNLFGDLLRMVIQGVLNDVSLMRGDELTWDVRGLEFPEESAEVEIKTVSDAMALNIPSDTMEREMYKKLVEVLFPEANSEVKQAMRDEIEKAPNREERMKKMFEARAGTIGSITSRFGKDATKE